MKGDQNEFQVFIGAVIKGARIGKGMSQKDIGEQLGYSANSASQAMSKIESGRISIPQKKIAKLVKILDLTHEQLGIEESISIPAWIAGGGSMTAIPVMGSLWSGIVQVAKANVLVKKKQDSKAGNINDVHGSGADDERKKKLELIDELCDDDVSVKEEIIRMLGL